MVESRHQIKEIAAARLQWFKALVDHGGNILLKTKDPAMIDELMQVLRAQDELYIAACADFGCKPEAQFKLANRMQLLLEKGLSNQVGLFAARNKVKIAGASLNEPDYQCYHV